MPNENGIWIMRHGTTDWNEQYRLQGRTDIPLNDDGRRMAETARAEALGIPFDVCYCSPLARARETAEIVLRGRDVPIRTDDRLIEMCFGVCEGMERIYSKPECPLNVFFQTPERYTEPVEGAESMDELFARTGEFLREVAYPELDKGRNLLIVGHGAMNSALICQIKELPRAEFWSAGLEQCKLMRLR